MVTLWREATLLCTPLNSGVKLTHLKVTVGDFGRAAQSTLHTTVEVNYVVVNEGKWRF